MNILGIGGVLGGAAAVLIRDGRIAGAVEEIKLTRGEESGRIPAASIQSCLTMGGIAPADVDYVALARPLPTGSALPIALRMFPNARVVSIDHHAAHAASAYLVSPFERATVVTLDREGDLRCGAKWLGEGNRLTLEREILYPDSVGELYGMVTEALGMRASSDEHRVQWLAPAGTPRWSDNLREVLATPEGFEGERRADLAASVQKHLEDYVLNLVGEAENVCLAGGVAWNSLLVSALENSGRYKGVFAQPAAGNAGTALGAALHVWHEVAGGQARVAAGGYALGPSYSAAEIKQVLENCKLRFQMLATVPDLIGAAVRILTDNRIVAWMQGRMEFGPRALGHRSILASPRDPYSTENLNTFIKHREASRKFAASVPAEIASEYFEAGPNARYLATVGRVRPQYREQLRGAVIAGDMVRVHTVAKDDNPLYWQLLHSFAEKSGLPILFNTSFNLFGEPLVCTPRDAVRSFYSSGIDAMIAGNFLLEK